MENIGGSSELIDTGTPAATNAGNGCSASDATDRVQRLDVGQTSSGICCAARCSTSSGSWIELMPCPIRSAPSSRSESQTVSGPVDSPACGTLCSPAARARAKWSAEPRPRHAELRAAETEADQSLGLLLQRDVEREVGGRDAGLAGDVEAPAQRDVVLGLDRAPGVLDRLAERLGRDPAGHRRVRRDGQLGVPDVLAARSTPMSRVSVHTSSRVADQVDHRQVDRDEVGEVGEREVVRQQVRVGRYRRAAGVPLGQRGHGVRRGRADVVHVQLGLGQPGDEGGGRTGHGPPP